MSTVISFRRGFTPAGLRGRDARYSFPPWSPAARAGSPRARREEITTSAAPVISAAVPGVGGARVLQELSGGGDLRLMAGVPRCVAPKAGRAAGGGALITQRANPARRALRPEVVVEVESTQSPTTGTTHFAQEASDHRSSARYRLFWITTPQATCGSQVLKHQANQGSRCASSSGNTGGGIERLV